MMIDARFDLRFLDDLIEQVAHCVVDILQSRGLGSASPSPTSIERALSAKELAEALGCCVGQIYKYQRQGMPRLMPGRYLHSACLAWLTTHNTPSTHPHTERKQS